MKTKQVIAIIGASGEMGCAIARGISKGNYRMLLHATDRDKIQLLIDDIKTCNPFADIEAVENFFEACWEADIIIVAVAYDAEKLVAYDIRKVTNQKIVVSVLNPANKPSGRMETADKSAAEELQMLLPNAKVVKVFNSTLDNDFYQPVMHGLQADCFIAGNDKEALEVVYELVKTAELNPIVAGDLSVSRTLEGMHRLLVQLTVQKNYRRTGWKILHD